MPERLGLGLAAVCVVAVMVAATATDPSAQRGVAAPAPSPSGAPAAPTSTPTTTSTGAPAPAGAPAAWVVTAESGTPLRDAADGVVDEVAAAGLTWPIVGETDGGYLVDTHCDRPGWVAADDVSRPLTERGPGLAGAVVVVDAGHGGADAGAIGPDGLTESEVNLAVADRLRDLLTRANDIDPDTGGVSSGDQWPAVSAVLMTRDPDDDVRGDQRTSLTFRGQLAARADADALVSVHHNAGDTSTFDDPPVEVLFSVDDDASSRLAGLVLEELRRSLDPLADSWQGTTSRGTIGRADPDGTDYYTVLQEAGVPAVITEGLYLSRPAGEAMARTDEFRQAYAEGLYRALVRFLATDEDGAEVTDPVTFEPGGSGAAYDFSDCSLAAPSAPSSSDSEG